MDTINSSMGPSLITLLKHLDMLFTDQSTLNVGQPYDIVCAFLLLLVLICTAVFIGYNEIIADFALCRNQFYQGC